MVWTYNIKPYGLNLYYKALWSELILSSPMVWTYIIKPYGLNLYYQALWSELILSSPMVWTYIMDNRIIVQYIIIDMLSISNYVD